MRRLPLRSPPRMRGKVWLHQKPGRVPGITPAYAGKSQRTAFPVAGGQDHPRVCGEKFRFILLSLLSSGSPPRVRGKAGGCRTAAASSGITPAYAGKSLLNTDNTTAARDHPRACGEKPPSCPEMSTNEGSPPRMRGKVGLLHGHIIAIGITPAHAGKRRSIGRLSQPTRDHPRVCGEKCSSVRSASHRRGSPPRVRGKVCDLTIIRVHHGITPAYAGKRLKRSHSIGHFSCILCLFHSVLHRASVSGGSRAGPRAPPCLPAQNTVPV